MPEETAQNIPHNNTEQIQQHQETELPQEQQQQQQSQPQHQDENSNESIEQVKEQAKFIPGKLAVCMHCGYLSEDFNKCLRCKRKLPEDVKSVSVTTTNNKVVDTLKNADKKLSPQKRENCE